MFTVTLSLGDRGYTREVWTWSCDMEVGGSGNEDMSVHETAACNCATFSFCTQLPYPLVIIMALWIFTLINDQSLHMITYCIYKC